MSYWSILFNETAGFTWNTLPDLLLSGASLIQTATTISLAMLDEDFLKYEAPRAADTYWRNAYWLARDASF